MRLGAKPSRRHGRGVSRQGSKLSGGRAERGRETASAALTPTTRTSRGCRPRHLSVAAWSDGCLEQSPESWRYGRCPHRDRRAAPTTRRVLSPSIRCNLPVLHFYVVSGHARGPVAGIHVAPRAQQFVSRGWAGLNDGGIRRLPRYACRRIGSVDAPPASPHRLRYSGHPPTGWGKKRRRFERKTGAARENP